MQGRIIDFVLLSLLATLLVACGGGSKKNNGGQQPPPPTVLGPGQVATNEGIIQGAVEGSLLVFRGVRYAATPIGDLRFKAPQPPVAFSGVRDALAFGSVCTQVAGMAPVGEEDCLFLNIWAHDDDVVRPVMVYMHPGSANGVGGNMSSIDAAELAESSDVVVVNLNRRVGAIGYLAIDELIAENPQLTAGNYGLLDAIAALEWVSSNIDELNGDPNRVMMFGTSAGGQLSCLILGAPAATGLIHSAAIQSAPCGGPILQVLNAQVPFSSNQPAAVVSHRAILAQTLCDAAMDVVACLRALTAEELTLAADVVSDAAGGRLFRPLFDGVVVTADPRTAVANQTIGDIPLIVGATDNEVGTTLDNLVLPDDAAYRAQLTVLLSDPLGDAVYALYPTANYATPKDAYVEMFSDLVYNCSAEWLARMAMTGAPSYLYEITRGFDTGSSAGRGAYHAIDIAYLFGNFSNNGTMPDLQSLFISDAMRRAWSSLAADPMAAPQIMDSGPVTVWPVYEPTLAPHVSFGDPISAGLTHRNGRCDALRTVLLTT